MSLNLKLLLTLTVWTLLLRPAGLSAADVKPKESLKLRVGLGSSPVPPLPNSVLWLARDLGFYQREGLDIELIEFQGTPLALAAMISGDIDVGNVSTSEVIRLSATKAAPTRACIFSSPPATRSRPCKCSKADPSPWRVSAVSITPSPC
jgi:ABC-type nitrate/sulfonate/bicarbonate transport system substrate-binding protein